MTLLHDPKSVGFVRRFVRVYREKRRAVGVWINTEAGATPLRYAHRRAPRRACAQIAWAQARNAASLRK